jgi:hypothetical protein
LFFRALVNTNVKNGLTGNIAFNEEGDRIESLYEVINIQRGQSTSVGTYRSNTVSLLEIYILTKGLLFLLDYLLYK